VTRRQGHKPFGPDFWCAYAANTALMVSVSALFRFADFITFLGGSEYELGWIVGIGMIGAITMRVFQGLAIDRYGAGNIWLLSLALGCLSLLSHLWIDTLSSPAIYLARVFYTISLAGAFGASITFVSTTAPRHRTGEVIGALGSSGFVGIASGPVVADWLFTLDGSPRDRVDSMFVAAAIMSGLAFCLAWLATRMGHPRRVVRRRFPIVGVVRRYHPGPMLLVAIAMGVGIGIPFSFLRTFTAELGIEGIRNFFLMYAAVAFVVRICCRQLPDRWGVKRTLLLGLTFLSISMVSYLVVGGPRTLLIPAALGGLAHAFVFPAAVAGSSLAFPIWYRGIATTLILTMFDIGSLVGQPAVGSILTLAKRSGWPAYPTMFVSVSIFLLAVAIYYALRPKRAPRVRPKPATTPIERETPAMVET
jgi:MFS family permease